MHLVVQIPCLNEEANIATVIAEIRQATSEFAHVSILVIDDGSTDGTFEAAQRAGADYIARHATNQGLARAFLTGLAAALNLGADIIVNTDADNQYKASGIRLLVKAIEENHADMVIGARPIEDTDHFSPIKKRLQLLGSLTARILSGTQVADATSGFRAMNREAAIRVNTFSDYTYTLETLIQAGRSGLRVRSVDIETNPPTRPSRLIKSMTNYVLRSAMDMLRIYTIYAPLRSYLIAGSVPFLISVFLGIRFLILIFLVDPDRTHAPSLILASIFAVLGFITWALGIIGDITSVNRRLLEDIRVNQRRNEAESGTLKGRTDFELCECRKQP